MPNRRSSDPPTPRAARRRSFQRDLLAGPTLDLFLVSAVSAVLLIRFYLHITNYPKVGGDSLHVAHMLWGGLLMLVAVVILLMYLDRSSRRVAALLGGVGFGTFIDEVGKFLTHDNDYFFRPSVAIIYVIFVLTYLAMRSLARRGASREEYVVNALQGVAQAASGELDADERERALGYLDESGRSDELVAVLRSLLRDSALAPAEDPWWFERWRRRIFRAYRRIAVMPGFARGLALFFGAQLVVKIGHALVFVIGDAQPDGIFARLQDPWTTASGEPTGHVGVALLGASLVQALLVGLGLVQLRRDRSAGLRLFQRSIFISIFLSQPLLFYRDQWTALIGLAFNVVVFLALRFMIEHDHDAPSPADAPPN